VRSVTRSIVVVLRMSLRWLRLLSGLWYVARGFYVDSSNLLA
jgi:hypothetical protein